MPKRAPAIALQPAVLKWARLRAGFECSQLAAKLQVKPEIVADWERSGKITMSQVERLAQKTHTPVGYLYLAEPPQDHLPIADLRTRSGEVPPKPSPNLLATVYEMQRRQGWMREEMLKQGEPPLRFVGAYGSVPSPQGVAAAMGQALGLVQGWARVKAGWSDALAALRDLIESAGVLVVFNGVVGNNTSRKLNAEEFQGFALVDEFAPLVFVNNTDFKTAQIFTLAHELAHIFIGAPGVSALHGLQPTNHAIEKRCDQIAAEFLVPEKELRSQWDAANNTGNPYRTLAKQFKVSTVVVARRALDTNLITRDAFFAYYEENKAKNWDGTPPQATGGGNFWSNQRWRLGPRFGAAVSRAVTEGRLSYTEAYRLTNLQGDTFAKMAEEMGVSS